MPSSVLAIGVGAALGAVSRWLLGLALNPVLPSVPLGTLAANLTGGYCMGLFAAFPSLSPEWRLFLATGFLGALTTFSAFSAETVALLQQGRPAVAAGAAALHVFGSVAMTFLGLASFAAFRR